MKLLGLDTSSLACSVALQVDDTVFVRHEERAREHTKLLVPMVRTLLEESSVRLVDLDAIVLGNGPGSFIGVRIAASVAQGIAFAAGVGIVPVSSMAAVAAEVFRRYDVEEVVVTQDAHMNEVYLGIFERGATGMPKPRIDERLHDQTAIGELEPADAADRVGAGFGWRRYPDLAAANASRLREIVAVSHPRAEFLLQSGADAFRTGRTLAPEDIVPAYLRQKVAEKPATTRP